MPLTINVPGTELWDSAHNMFITTKPCTLVLEHSLISISKWESKHHKMWLETKDKTGQEYLDYIRCMTINGNVPETAYYALTQKDLEDILKYMEDPMTASYVSDVPNSKSRQEPVSSELIYYWMITYGIPVEFEKWHINRLLMLIKICTRKAGNMSKADKKAMDQRRAEINRARRAKLGTKG